MDGAINQKEEMTMKRVLTSIQAMSLLLFAVAIMTACSNDDNILDEPAITEGTPKSYTLTVEAAKGEDATHGSNAPRRALSLDGKTLNATWAAGEEVRVYSVTGEGYEEMESVDPVGTLTAQRSGATTTLKGTFIASYTPTAGAKLRLKFCYANYDNQKGTLEYIAANCDYATAEVTISEVGTDGDVTTTAASFDNQQAIVKFSLKNKATDAALAATSLTVNYGSATYDVTLDDPATDIYVAIPQKSNKAVTLTATTADGNFSYEKSGITFEKGRYYAIGVKMTRIPTLGDLYYSDGTFSMTLEAGKTPIGVIAYVGTDAFTENGVTLRDGTTTLESHGLVLGLKNIAHVMWRKRQSEGGPANVIDFSEEAIVNDRSDLLRTTNVSGYANTKFLAEKTDAATNYPAAYQAWNYSVLTAPATTTGWFMPSMQQWVKILTALGRMSESDIVWQAWKDPSLTTIHNLEAAMEKAGAKGTAYDGMSDDNRNYWSSSESNAGYATSIAIYPTISNNQQGLYIAGFTKWNNWNYYVRPVLAF